MREKRCLPVLPDGRNGKLPYTMENKGKQKDYALRLGCFICGDLYLARECPKREALNIQIKKSEKEEEDACLGSM